MGIDGPRLGIDLGTSNTTAVVSWSDGRVRPLLFDGSPVLPSGVYAEPGHDLVVGRDAAYAARIRPECFEPYPKRCVDDDSVLLGGVPVSVEEMITAVLRRVAAQAAPAGEGPPVRAVITCPAGWGRVRQRRLLDAAGQVFEEAVLAAEPVAAASYFLTMAGDRMPVGARLLVYDLGAGTFDVSIVRRTADGFEVLASDGLPDAGGLDIDAAIVASLGRTYAARDAATWARLVRPQTSGDRRASRALWEDVRTGKELLSRSAATVVHIPLFEDDAALPREQVEELARPVLARTVEVTRSLLAAVGVAAADLTGVFLVGGSSRMPLVASLLHQRLGVAPTVVEQPELVVAEGSLRAQPLPLPVTVSPASVPVPPEGEALWPPPARVVPATAPRAARTGRRTRVALAATAAAVVAVVVAVDMVGGGGGDPGGAADRSTGPTGAASVSPSPTGPPVVPEPRRVDVPNDGGDSDAVRYVTLSPNGKLIAAVRTKSVRLYDAVTLKQLGDPIDSPGDAYWTAAFSPDSRTLVTAADGLSTAAVRVWDVSIHGYYGTLSDAFWTSCLTFGPTAKLLAVCDGPGQTVRLWDPAARRSLGRVASDDPAAIRYVAFSPDGRTMATDGGQGATLLWDVGTRQRLGVLQGFRPGGVPMTDPGAALAFSPDGKTLAVGGADGTVVLWTVANRRKVAEFTGAHNNRVAALAFSPDGRTLASLGGTTLRLWDVASRQPAAAAVDDIADYYSAQIKQRKGPDLRFGADGRTLIGCFDNHLLTWDLTLL
ncbi:Hsp70 family protein [Phytohabitans rumicis]|uniref:Hsp70 family protein n=1 Tax=Phytohabitans rumicis TaxID=1076125 RepID=UPI001565B313|nr:Hsp70 family protein [Phytohabitans rumicis]